MAFKKYAPKNVKVCPGCPPKDIPTITFPKMKLTLPNGNSNNNTQVVSIKPNTMNKRNRRGNNMLF